MSFKKTTKHKKNYIPIQPYKKSKIKKEKPKKKQKTKVKETKEILELEDRGTFHSGSPPFIKRFKKNDESKPIPMNIEFDGNEPRLQKKQKYKKYWNAFNIKMFSDYLDPRIIPYLQESNLQDVEIYITSLPKLLQEFSGDENVQYRLKEENNLGMNRTEDRQILIRLDHPSFKKMDEDDKFREIMITIFHEWFHVSEDPSDEINAEENARDLYGDIYFKLLK